MCDSNFNPNASNASTVSSYNYAKSDISKEEFELRKKQMKESKKVFGKGNSHKQDYKGNKFAVKSKSICK